MKLVAAYNCRLRCQQQGQTNCIKSPLLNIFVDFFKDRSNFIYFVKHFTMCPSALVQLCNFCGTPVNSSVNVKYWGTSVNVCVQKCAFILGVLVYNYCENLLLHYALIIVSHITRTKVTPLFRLLCAQQRRCLLEHKQIKGDFVGVYHYELLKENLLLENYEKVLKMQVLFTELPKTFVFCFDF